LRSNNRDLLDAVAKGRLDRVRKLLRSGASPDARDATGNTALMIAVQQAGRSVVRCLLKAGAIPDLQNRSGQTALMLAAIAGRLPTVRALIEGGATLDLVNRKRETALTYAIVWHRPKVVDALLRAGADVEKPRGPWSPLMYAAFEGDLRSAQLLLKRGASRSRVDSHRRTAADIARDARHFLLSAATRS
jgi:uncharacterized protein